MITLLKSLAALLKEPRIAIFKTIIANFRCFPYGQAIHLPLFLYGNITFINEGHISLRPTYLTPGLIKLGKTDSIIWGSGGGNYSRFVNKGEWTVNGVFNMANGCLVSITEDAVLETGHGVRLGPLSKLMCAEGIKIGRRTGISWECQIFDTDFHFMIFKGQVGKKTKKIHIGDHCWIGNRVNIMKGAYLDDYSVVASNSMVNKDYGEYGQKCVFAGTPAQFKANGAQRFYISPKLEREMEIYFSKEGKEKLDVNDPGLKPFLDRILK